MSRRGAATGGNAYQRYLTAIERGEPLSQPMLEDAFGAVNKTFLPRARAAGYDIATVHHWNWPKAQYPGQVVDPRNLIPIPEQSLLSGGYHPTHYGIHQLTSSGTNVYVDPTGAIHVISIEKWMGVDLLERPQADRFRGVGPARAVRIDREQVACAA